MTILGIDYGRKKVGIALSVNGFAEPYSVIHFKNNEYLMNQIKNIAEKEKPGRIVVGISEGEMEVESRNFSKSLDLGIEVETFDETLTSYDANQLSINMGIGQKRRHEMEDAFAAAIMLQNYLIVKKP